MFGFLRSAQRGFSATDAAVFLLAATVVTSAGAPAVDNYLDMARLVKAQSDLTTIAVAVVRFSTQPGGGFRAATSAQSLQLLISRGEAPAGDGAAVRSWLLPFQPGVVETLEDHLSTNRARSSATGQPHGMPWRGPYIEAPIASDPWGHRYAVNVAFLQVPTSNDVVALSAGPDGVVQTPFSADGLKAGGDDLVALVSSGW